VSALEEGCDFLKAVIILAIAVLCARCSTIRHYDEVIGNASPRCHMIWSKLVTIFGRQFASESDHARLLVAATACYEEMPALVGVTGNTIDDQL
jgi:hypothetical protein